MKEFPKNPFHPGEILLEEFLEPAGISQAAFAMQIGWTRARLNELIKGKRGITADAALDLSEAVGTSARLWMNLQATWDLSQALRRRKALFDVLGGVTATARGELCPAISMLDEFQRKGRVTFRSLDLRALSSNRPTAGKCQNEELERSV